MSHNNSRGRQQGSGRRGGGARGARDGYGGGGDYENYRNEYDEDNEGYRGYADYTNDGSAGDRARLGPAAQPHTQQQAPMMPQQAPMMSQQAPMMHQQAPMMQYPPAYAYGHPAYPPPLMYSYGYYPPPTPMPHQYPAPQPYAFQPYAPRPSPVHHAPAPTAADVDFGIRAEIEDLRSELARTDALLDASSRDDFSHARGTPSRGGFSHARDTPSRGGFTRDGSSRGGSSHGGHSRHEPSRRERSRQRSRSPKAEASHTSGSTHRQRSPVIGRGIREAVSHLKAPPGTEVDEPCTHCLPRHGLRVARSHYAHECAQLSNPIRSDDRRELRNAFLRRKGERKPLGVPRAKAKEGVADSASADAPVTAPTSDSIGTIGRDAGAAQPSQPSPPTPVTGAGWHEFASRR